MKKSKSQQIKKLLNLFKPLNELTVTSQLEIICIKDDHPALELTCIYRIQSVIKSHGNKKKTVLAIKKADSKIDSKFLESHLFNLSHFSRY
jgi:hypothetical protein